MNRVKEGGKEGDCTPWMDSGVVVVSKILQTFLLTLSGLYNEDLRQICELRHGDSLRRKKQEPVWSMKEDSPDQPSAVYSTVQPMHDNTSGSLLSLNTSHVCQHCSAAFVLVSSLELHLASVHGEPLPMSEWTGSSDRLMSTPHGSLPTEEVDHVRKYSADSETEFVLKLEPAWSTEEDSPDQPSAVYSSVQPMYDNTSGSLLSLNTSHECYLCSAAFALVSSLELHLASVHGEKLDMVLPGPSTPDRCDAGNYSNAELEEVDRLDNRKIASKKKIVDNDTGDQDGKKRRKQYVCDVCTKSFSAPSYLKRHKLFHSGVKEFVCDVCSKSFTLASHLTTHKRIHTGERPYRCPHCDSGFTLLSNLQLHIKSVHDNARPHVCDVCEAAFSRAGDLTVHRRIHTGEKPHVCSDCGKGFAQPGALARHRLTHTGHKPHSCPHCPAGFRYSYQLKAHIQSEHQ